MNATIASPADRSTPVVRLHGIPGLDRLGEQLRECGLRALKRRGVKVWTRA